MSDGGLDEAGSVVSSLENRLLERLNNLFRGTCRIIFFYEVLVSHIFISFLEKKGF